jgi:CelD/BcsL family acetyltransferase involved in cellulose biosynthesis
MDRQTRHEYDRLIEAFTSALEAVRSAVDEEEEMAAWRRIQAAGWELNALLPKP